MKIIKTNIPRQYKRNGDINFQTVSQIPTYVSAVSGGGGLPVQIVNGVYEVNNAVSFKQGLNIEGDNIVDGNLTVTGDVISNNYTVDGNLTVIGSIISKDIVKTLSGLNDTYYNWSNAKQAGFLHYTSGLWLYIDLDSTIQVLGISDINDELAGWREEIDSVITEFESVKTNVSNYDNKITDLENRVTTLENLMNDIRLALDVIIG